MKTVSERLKDITVQAISPDQWIAAKLHNGSKIAFALRRPTLSIYQQNDLETQLSTLLTDLYARYENAIDQILEGTPFTKSTSRRAKTLAHKALHEDCAQVENTATSPNGSLTITSIGLRTWSVRLRNFTKHADPKQLTSELSAATTIVIREHHRQVQALKQKHLSPLVFKANRTRAQIR